MGLFLKETEAVHRRREDVAQISLKWMPVYGLPKLNAISTQLITICIQSPASRPTSGSATNAIE